MKCEVCAKGMPDGVTLWRQNAKGEIGIWRCTACNKLPRDPETVEVVEVIESSIAAIKSNGDGKS